jgi:transcriptional regulator with XRE-family HTH domain
MPTLRKEFGHRLRTIRLERKMSQEKFAEVVGISVDFLSLIERGRNAPSFETIENMAKKLRVPVMELFDFRREDRAAVPRERVNSRHP